jgi:vesicle-fusing ATPase
MCDMMRGQIGFQMKKTESHEVYDTEQLSQVFITVRHPTSSIRRSLFIANHELQAFSNLPLTPLQTLMFDYRGQVLKATVRSVSTLEGSESSSAMGIIMEGTEITWFKDPSSAIKLKNSSNRAPTQAIIAPNFKFEDMGIGGLDTEFQAIFRRAFASRVFPPGLVEKLGITHAKGSSPSPLQPAVLLVGIYKSDSLMLISPCTPHRYPPLWTSRDG